MQSELRRLLGRTGPPMPINVAAPQLAAGSALDVDSADLAIENRPQLLALQALVERNTRSLDLAQREYYPDFDLKLQYGQRDRAPDGMPRDDMVSLTVGLNLPIWRKSRLEPQVATIAPAHQSMRQKKPHSGAVRFGGHVRFEEALPDLRGKAPALVVDREAHAGGAAFDPDRDPAARRTRLDGVDDQRLQHRLEFGRNSRDAERTGGWVTRIGWTRHG